VYAVFVGALSLRTKGVYFIMVTLAFAQMAYSAFHDTKLGGGTDGIYLDFKPEVSLFGVRWVDLGKPVAFYYVVLACLVLVFLFLAILLRSRFGRVLEIEAMRATMPLSVFFFDCLHANGEALTQAPASERFEALSGALSPELLMPRVVPDDSGVAEAFYDDALRRGHEGVMAKSLTAPYEAGRRAPSWRKIKRTHTLDLVVLAAEWGHGRRHGRLSNLHLGARDEATGAFVMLGKTFKGMTDEMLAWQTQAMLALEVARDGATVHLRPELVVEVAFNDLQSSPRYPGGLALRFARVKRHRDDKRAAEADTVATVRAIYEGQLARGTP